MTALDGATEHWIVHHAAAYDAVPWPYAKSWADFVRQPDALIYPAGGFGQVSPSDGFGETGAVPAHLPRKCTQGQYELAVYHDAEAVYVILAAALPEPIPDLAQHDGFRLGIALQAPEATWYWQSVIDQEGAAQSHAIPNVGGSRLRVCGQDELIRQDVGFGRSVARLPVGVPYEHALIRDRNGRALAVWRLNREGMTPFLQGNRFGFSAMSMHDASLEAAAWGAHLVWHLRPDEVGTVHLVGARQVPPWPVVREAHLDYDPATESGKLRLCWDGPYGSEESLGFEDIYGHAHFGDDLAPKDKCLVNVNGVEVLLPLAETVEADVSLVDGENAVRIRTVGGMPCLFSIKKFSGNHIIDPPAGGGEVRWDGERLRRLVEAAFARFREDQHERLSGPRTNGIAVAVAASNAAGLGYVCLCHERRDEYAESLRAEAESTLELQHEDGTVRTFHLGRPGEPPPAWAGGAYDTGRIGELWLAAYRVLGDDRFMQASHRLVKAFGGYRLEYNHNYAAFGMWHLAAHYRLTRDPLALEHLLYYAKHAAAALITPCGFQGGHNFYTCYGAITLRALAQCCALLPADQPYRRTLRELCIRMANQVVSRLQPDGTVAGTDRMNIALRQVVAGPCLAAFLLPPEDACRLDAVIARMLCAAETMDERSAMGRLFFAGDLCRYATQRDALLGGKTVDAFAVI